ncbi:16626_t:CDS:2, partial [Acaulospora colombiana]
REFPVGNPEYFRMFAEVAFGVEELAEFSFTDTQPTQAPPPTTSAPSQTASTSAPSAAQPSPATVNRPAQPTQVPAPPQQQSVNVTSFSAEKAMPAGWNGYGQQGTQPQPPTQQYNQNLNTVDRAMGAMKLNNGAPSQPKGPVAGVSGSGPAQTGRHTPRGQGGGPRRGRGGNRGNGHQSHQAAQEIKIPTTDFDFQASNRRFDKTSIAKHHQFLDATSPDGTTPTNTDAPENPTVASPNEAVVDETADATDKKEDDKAYNPTRSFFDNISSDLTAKKAASRPAAGTGAAL